jgi:hypothetical protein
MQRKRKLWATQFWGVHTPRSAKHRHESKAAVYRYVEAQVANWLDGAVLSKTLTVFVDERDGLGWQLHERIDLDKLAKAGGSDA